MCLFFPPQQDQYKKCRIFSTFAVSCANTVPPVALIIIAM